MQLGLIVAAALVAMWLKICSACADTLCMSPRAGAGARERVQFTTPGLLRVCTGKLQVPRART